MENLKIDKPLVLNVLDCLIDTAKRLTDLENVYDDSKGINSKSVTWCEVEEVRKRLHHLDYTLFCDLLGLTTFDGGTELGSSLALWEHYTSIKEAN